MKPLWPHLRGLLVAVHVLAIVLMALPAPEGGMNRSYWKDPTVQAEIGIWKERLAGIGVGTSWTRTEFEDRLWGLSDRFLSLRKGVLAPLQPYYRWCGTRQSWRMFAAPHMHPARLVVRVRGADEGEWRVVYRQLDPEANWREHTFESDRFRSILFRYPWKKYHYDWYRLANWIQLRAAEDFPEATEADMAWHKARTPSPSELEAGIEPAVTVLHRQVRSLEEARRKEATQ